MPNARTAVTAAIRYRIGGCSAAREMSQAEVAARPIAATAAPTPARTARTSRPETGPPRRAMRTSGVMRPPRPAAAAETAAAAPSARRRPRHRHHAVSQRRGGWPVGHEEHRRPAACRPRDRAQDGSLGGLVETRRRLVEKQERAPAKQRPGHADPPPLPAREPRAALAQDQARVDVAQPDRRQRRDDRRIRRVRRDEADVVRHASRRAGTAPAGPTPRPPASVRRRAPGRRLRSRRRPPRRSARHSAPPGPGSRRGACSCRRRLAR